MRTSLKQIIDPYGCITSRGTNKPSILGSPANSKIYDVFLNCNDPSCIESFEDYNAQRILAATYSAHSLKVPVSVSTVNGCVRSNFIKINPALFNSSCSCYDGDCYLYHARQFPAKKRAATNVTVNEISLEHFKYAALIARHLKVPLRDNQSSCGSMTMAINTRDGVPIVLPLLETLQGMDCNDVKYVCISAGYVNVPLLNLKQLSLYKNLVVHVTVSGWHSLDENLLRFREFERYTDFLPNVFLRLVFRKDWSILHRDNSCHNVFNEDWVVDYIEKKGFGSKVVLTPFHSIQSFDGSSIRSLGTRHMANVGYRIKFLSWLSDGASECCMSGKCITCQTKCGTSNDSIVLNSSISILAYKKMINFIKKKAHKLDLPIYDYALRILYKEILRCHGRLGVEYDDTEVSCLLDGLKQKINKLNLSSKVRHRLACDAHALVHDGIDCKNFLK